MSLKLFRSTGYSSILAPGETRVLMHPAWLVLAVSGWVGFACNVALWRELGANPQLGLGRALLVGWAVAAVCGLVLSLLGWRRTLKPAATLLLLVAAVLASGVWVQGVPVDASLGGQRLGALLPTWASLLRWQVPTLLAVLGLVPMLWVWNTELRRLPGPVQFRANVSGMVLAALLGGGALYLLLR